MAEPAIRLPEGRKEDEGSCVPFSCPTQNFFGTVAPEAGMGLADAGAVQLNAITGGFFPSLRKHVQQLRQGDASGVLQFAAVTGTVFREAVLSYLSAGIAKIAASSKEAGYTCSQLRWARALQPLVTVREGYQVGAGLLAAFEAAEKHDPYGLLLNGLGAVAGIPGLAANLRLTRQIVKQFRAGGINALKDYFYRTICFAPETRLLTPDGMDRAICDFKPGDLILSAPEFDPTAPPEAKVVEEVFINDGELLTIKVRGRSIRTTAEHPFYVRGKGWKTAWELAVGDELRSHDEQWVPVEEIEETGERSVVYNLRVADYHTYFVGCQEWGFSVWAHNAACAEEVWKAIGGRGRIPPESRDAVNAVVAAVNRRAGPKEVAELIRQIPGGPATASNARTLADAALAVLPSRAAINRATKILEQYERLAAKYGINLPPRKLEQLNALRDAGRISSSDLPAGLLREFPGELGGMSLAEIRALP